MVFWAPTREKDTRQNRREFQDRGACFLCLLHLKRGGMVQFKRPRGGDSRSHLRATHNNGGDSVAQKINKHAGDTIRARGYTTCPRGDRLRTLQSTVQYRTSQYSIVQVQTIPPACCMLASSTALVTCPILKSNFSEVDIALTFTASLVELDNA